MLQGGVGNKDVWELLISAGADINCCNADKQTLLHYAALHGWFDTVEYLLNKGLDVDAKGYLGNTPLLNAAIVGNKDVCQLLISAGADINSKNSFGDTALHWGACWNSSEIVDHLLRAGADYNLVNKNGVSTLYLFMERNEIGAIRLCLEMGACVDDFDSEKLQELPFNKFNKRDLPVLYKVSAASLPPVDKLCMKKGSGMALEVGSGMALEVEQAVTHEIQAKGHCDVVRARPVVLSMLAVRSFIEAIKSRGTLTR